VRHESAALRYKYSDISPVACAISHFNLARYLKRTNADAQLPLAHRFASALIMYQTNHGQLTPVLLGLRDYFAGAQPEDLPATFDEVCGIVEQIEGVRFRQVFERLPKRAASGDEALQALLVLARQESNPMPPASADAAAS
jgi:hypothetical protein